VPPALIVLVDDPDETDSSLTATLDLARRVGGVGRVLLFHPPDAESKLIARSLGYRLWPQSGATSGQRYANAFRQAADLGYEGAAVITLDAADDLTAASIGEAVSKLQEHHGAIVPDGRGGIAALVLQEPQPTLFPGDDVPTYDELVTRAGQQRVRLVELPAQEAVRR
jgi:glycosyltransferase A (GT-A) superfamily protein (DUF2064 family)